MATKNASGSFSESLTRGSRRPRRGAKTNDSFVFSSASPRETAVILLMNLVAMTQVKKL